MDTNILKRPEFFDTGGSRKTPHNLPGNQLRRRTHFILSATAGADSGATAVRGMHDIPPVCNCWRLTKTISNWVNHLTICFVLNAIETVTKFPRCRSSPTVRQWVWKKRNSESMPRIAVGWLSLLGAMHSHILPYMYMSFKDTTTRVPLTQYTHMTENVTEQRSTQTYRE